MPKFNINETNRHYKVLFTSQSLGFGPNTILADLANVPALIDEHEESWSTEIIEDYQMFLVDPDMATVTPVLAEVIYNLLRTEPSTPTATEIAKSISPD